MRCNKGLSFPVTAAAFHFRIVEAMLIKLAQRMLQMIEDTGFLTVCSKGKTNEAPRVLLTSSMISG